MNNVDQTTQMLVLLLICAVVILFVLIIVYVILAIITFIFRGVPVFGFPIIGLACLGCIIAVVMNIIEYRKLIKIEEANGELTRQKRNQNKR